jgi:hypothetical protein
VLQIIYFPLVESRTSSGVFKSAGKSKCIAD